MAASELWLYRADHDQLKPVRVHCPKGRYPAHDADGHPIYDNSHFDTEQEAWKNLLDNAKAGVSLAGSRVRQAQQAVLDANRNAAEAAVEFATVLEHHRDWLSNFETKSQPPTEELCDE